MKRVYLEITDACNLNCPFCRYDKGNSFMTLSEIDDYTSQIAQFCSYIYLHVLGEPLLHPRFDEILDILDDKGFHLQLVTNGTLLNRYPDLLKHPCLRKLSISIHSVSHLSIGRTYFDTIDSLIESSESKTIELRFYNEKALSEDLAEYRKQLISRYGLAKTRKSNSWKLKDSIYLYEEDFFRWPDLEDPIIGCEGSCHGAIDMIAINHEGKVCICCLDPKAINFIGDLKKDTLEAILQSEIYQNYIASFREHRITSDLCARCTYRLRF